MSCRKVWGWKDLSSMPGDQSRGQAVSQSMYRSSDRNGIFVNASNAEMPRAEFVSKSKLVPAPLNVGKVD